uniref:Uncharacterized protein n=1 Tax=Arion vulgaris TaxID=1028688 RepID=A0A0B6YRD3_9EUPU
MLITRFINDHKPFNLRVRGKLWLKLFIEEFNPFNNHIHMCTLGVRTYVR